MSKRIPEHKVEEIYSAADIVEVIGDFLQLKKRGRNFFALSPFSNEKTPSFAVSPSKNIFKDFSTGKGGNAVTFLMEAEGMTYVEALRYLADKYNIELEWEESQEDAAYKDLRDSLLVLNTFAADFFQAQLLEKEEGRITALPYFEERGVSLASINTFQLGYAPDQWSIFTEAAKKQQFEESYLLETGLSFRSEKSNRLLDRYRGRIIFPIHDHLGKIIGFGGRVIKKADKAAKYVNSPESSIYDKSKVLYGLYFSKQYIRDEDECILTEGYMDVISLYQNEIRNVVASSGTALTVEQIRLLRRFSKNVLLIYDSDKAGIDAAMRGADLMLENDLNVKVLLLPEQHDPDSYVKAYGKSGFDNLKKNEAKDFIQFKLDFLKKDANISDPQEKVRLVHEIAGSLSKISDPVKLGVYKEVTAESLEIEAGLITAALQRALNATKRYKKKEVINPLPPTRVKEGSKTFPDAQEIEILRLLLNYGEEEVEIEGEKLKLVAFVKQELETLTFTSPLLEQLKQDIFGRYESGSEILLNAYLQHHNPDIAKITPNFVSIPIEVSDNWLKYDIKAPKADANLQEAVYSATLHFKLRKINALIKENREKLLNADQNEQQEQLLEIHRTLNNLKMELAKRLGIVIQD